MSLKERNQNPVVGDDIKLRLVTFNSNNLTNVSSIEKVDIFFLECKEKEDVCKIEKKSLVDTFPGSQVVLESTGNYSLIVSTSAPKYTTGHYLDVWSVVFKPLEPTAEVKNIFTIFPDQWFTLTIPAVYSFDFQFQPNRIRQGSIKWLIIQIMPNVPRATDLERYYINLAIAANLKIFIQLNCGPCPPNECDLRMIVDGELVDIRDKVFGFFKLDTTEWDCGIYDVWFELDYADTVEISPKQQIQVY